MDKAEPASARWEGSRDVHEVRLDQGWSDGWG